MAEKRLSVRLVAEGGRQFRAEITGIGNEGAASFQRMSSEVDRAGVVLTRLAGIAAGALSVRQVVQYADSWSDMRSQIGAAIGDMDGASDMMQRMVDVANASYAPLDQTVQIYSRNVAVMRDLGYTARQTADFTEALNHALVITATKGQQAEAVQNALSKAMATGKLSGIGLETVLASGGEVARRLAATLGTTVSGLRALASQGKITGDAIARALIEPLDDLRRIAGDMDATVADGFQRINTGLMAVIGSFDQATGASKALADALVLIGDKLRALALVDWANAAEKAVRTLGGAVTVLAATQIPALVTSLVTLGTTMKGVGVLFAAQYYAAVALTPVLARLSAVVATLGGPMGLLAAGLAALGVAMWNARSRSDDIRDALDELNASQGGVNEKMRIFAQERTPESLNAMLSLAEMDNVRAQAALQAARAEDERIRSVLDWSPNLLLMFQRFSGRNFLFGEDFGKTLRDAEVAAEGTATWLERAQRIVSGYAGSLNDAAGRVVDLDNVLIRAGDAATARLNDLIAQQREAAELRRIELEYGRDSLEYINARAAGERQVLALKLDQAVAAAEDKAAARAMADEVLRAADYNARLEGAIRRLTGEYGLAEGAARKIAVAVTSISDALSNALGPAAQLRSLLGAIGTAAAESPVGQALGAAGGLLQSAGKSLLNTISAAIPKVRAHAVDLGRRLPGGGGGGGGGGGAGLDEAAEAAKRVTEAIADLNAESEKLNATWAMTDLQAAIWERLRDLGVDAASAQGQVISGLMTQIDHLKQLKTTTEEWRDSVVDAFAQFIVKGGSFKQVISQIIAKLAEMAAQSAMKNLWNGFGGNSLFGDVIGALSKVVGSADGNAFSNGRLLAFANGGVIGGPTLFPMRGGRIGLMGEAGPEAVMPLKRGPDGKLGVRALANGGGNSQTVVRVELSSDLVGWILDQAGAQAVQLVQAADRLADRRLPGRLAQIQQRPRMR